MKEIKFAWVCRNIHYDKIERVELTDKMLLSGARPSWITSTNCEVLAEILPTGKLDKNGKEIWEGDILHKDAWGGQRNIEGVVVWHIIGWALQAKGESCPYGFSGVDFEESEIIGNIWEGQDTEEL